jgi:hypothetical protein
MKSIIYIILSIILLSMMSCNLGSVVIDPLYPRTGYYYNPYGEYWYRPLWYNPFWGSRTYIYQYYPPNSRQSIIQTPAPRRHLSPNNQRPSRGQSSQPQRYITPRYNQPQRSTTPRYENRSPSQPRYNQPQRYTTPSRRGGN